MKQELEDQLINRFPQYFKEVDNTCPFFDWGFEVGDELYEIMWEMFKRFEQIEIEHPPRVAQVKMKFGDLCVYLDFIGPTTDEQRDAFYDAITKAEWHVRQIRRIMR